MYLQLKAYDNNKLVTSSFDQGVSVWNTEESKLAFAIKGL